MLTAFIINRAPNDLSQLRQILLLGLRPDDGENPGDIAFWLNEYAERVCAHPIPPMAEGNDNFKNGFVIIDSDVPTDALTQLANHFDVDLKILLMAHRNCQARDN